MTKKTNARQNAKIIGKLLAILDAWAQPTEEQLHYIQAKAPHFQRLIKKLREEHES